jgi:hypothetical protein
MSIEPPELLVVGDVYRFLWPVTGIEITMDRMAEAKEGIQTEITIARTLGVVPGLLHYARLNLLSTQTRALLVKALTIRADDIDWTAALEQACLMAVNRYRTGDPVVDLRLVNLNSTTRWRIRPFVEDNAATILFADGGTGKSFFALAMGVTQATGTPVLGELDGKPGPVLYLDWEADEGTHAERLAAITLGADLQDPPAIYYRRMVASLKESAPYVRKDIAQLGIQLVIVDSLGAAKGGEPEGADSSIALFTAARSFGVPWIGIDHITKATTNPTSGKGRPYGSTYTHNLARLTWSLEQAEEQQADGFAVVLTNHKRNNGRQLPRQAYSVVLETCEGSDRLRTVRFSPIDVRSNAGLVNTLPLKDRLISALNRGARSNKDLYQEFPDESEATIRARIKELKDHGRVIQVPGERWGLIG